MWHHFLLNPCDALALCSQGYRHEQSVFAVYIFVKSFHFIAERVYPLRPSFEHAHLTKYFGNALVKVFVYLESLLVMLKPTKISSYEQKVTQACADDKRDRSRDRAYEELA